MAMDWSLAHVNDRTGLIIMCVIFSISSTAVVVLRFWSRRFKKLRWQADDWTMVVALVCCLLPDILHCLQRLIGSISLDICRRSEWNDACRMRTACPDRPLASTEQIASPNRERACGATGRLELSMSSQPS